MPAACFGPYLRYAIATNFRNFVRFHKNQKFNLFLIIEFMDGVVCKDFADAMTQYKIKFRWTPNYETRYFTAHADMDAVGDDTTPIWESFVSRVELSLPMEEETELREHKLSRAPHRHKQSERILIGILDDGCPFAADRFLRKDGSGGTRLLALWDQNPGRRSVDVEDERGGNWLFGQKLPEFGYGREYLRDSQRDKDGDYTGLNHWIKLHTKLGLVDEDGCYADAGFDSLRFQESHGAHVMDVFAGPKPTSSRLSSDRIQPPTFACATDAASAADIVFVQFPKSCIEDASGVWLDAYVLDGMRYILLRAGAAYDRVIVNISYGRTTGPHNGTALLEQALTEMVTQFDGTASDKPKLDIAVAVGNYYLTDSHVVFVKNEEARPIEWTWRLPPDNAAMCFAEIWMKNADAKVSVTLTSPSGVKFNSTVAMQPMDPAGVEGGIFWGGDNTVWRLQVEATEIAPKIVCVDLPDNVVGEYGSYTITVSGVPPNAEVHGYVARTDPNMDVLPGAKPSYFVDPQWQNKQAASASCIYADGEFDNSGSFVSRYGTLNGIGTAENASVHVAGGYIASNERKSTYSSAGPARHGPLAYRTGPDFLLPCDESYALEGVPAGGNRSGVVFRLIGTSTAAPQLARWISREVPLQPTGVPPSTDVEGIEQRGGGYLDPP
jgi:hypothetical protein